MKTKLMAAIHRANWELSGGEINSITHRLGWAAVELKKYRVAKRCLECPTLAERKWFAARWAAVEYKPGTPTTPLEKRVIAVVHLYEDQYLPYPNNTRLPKVAAMVAAVFGGDE